MPMAQHRYGHFLLTLDQTKERPKPVYLLLDKDANKVGDFVTYQGALMTAKAAFFSANGESNDAVIEQARSDAKAAEAVEMKKRAPKAVTNVPPEPKKK